MRASDVDRQKTVAALERHTGAGRLTLDEFAERAQLVHDARTLDQLAEVMRALPAEPAPPPEGPRAATRSAWAPSSVMRPSSTTATRSASCAENSRCAIATTVRPRSTAA